MVATEARAFIGLGGNLGDARAHVGDALDALDRIPGTRLRGRSRLYRTRPWGILEQPEFVNAAAEVATALSPRELLQALLAIERTHGRRRNGVRWGPRALDLDLLLHGSLQSVEPGLVLPHPCIAQRTFVLVPLAEIDAGLVIPGQGTVRALLERLDASDCVPLE